MGIGCHVELVGMRFQEDVMKEQLTIESRFYLIDIQYIIERG
jgi:hypothetical protein